MGIFSTWSQNRAEEKDKKSYRSGYDLAAGWLLRGERTIGDIENMADTSSAFSEGRYAKSFDRGMRDAVSKLLAVGAIEDTRVY